MQCPKCQFENPEGMKFCGGFGLALKGPQHDEARLIFLDMVPNFRAPDLSRENFLGGPDIKGIYKNCRKIKRKFKMQHHL